MSRHQLCRSDGLVLLMVSLPVFLAQACKTEERIEKFNYPEGEFSSTLVDFGTVELNASISRTVWFENTGDLTMGVSSITLGETDESGHFQLSWSTAEIECPETVDTSTTARLPPPYSSRHRKWSGAAVGQTVS